MRVGFATKDGIHVNDHFGRANEFAVFDIDEKDFSLVEKRQVDQFDPDFEPEELDKIDARIKAIQDCAIVYCNNIGAVSAARVIRNKIHPIKVAEEVLIAGEIARLQQMLQKPPIWIKKIQMNGVNP